MSGEEPIGNTDENKDGEDDDYIDEEEMLDVAEKCFVRIAQEIVKNNLTVRSAFQNFMESEEIEG